MANFYREPDRRQRFLLPVDMADWVPDTDLVHLLLDAVGLMDLSAFEAHYRKRGCGAPPFAPRMMVGLLVYAYANGQRSSRKIERLCERDAGFRMIVGAEVPDHSVIARFRKRHRGDLEVLFVEILKLCHAAGLVRLGVVALDGTKVKANASLVANRTSKSLEAEVAAMLAAAEAIDAAEDEMFGEARGDELPADLREPSGRLSRLRSCHERLLRAADGQRAEQQEKIDARAAGEKASGRRKRGRKPKAAEGVVNEEAKANVTDPDSRIMKSRKGYLQGYNAQAMVTADQIILAPDVTNQANDVRQLAPMIARTLAMMEAVTGDEVALGVGLFDAGYWSDENAAAQTAECEYLIATTKDWKRRKAMRDAPPPRGRCPADMSARDRMERKLLTKRGRALYRLRGQTVEPVFGQMKETQGADRFMMRGEQETKGEWSLHCSAHNIKKLHSPKIRDRILDRAGALG
ncbi:IS1182 family transposase [Aquabacter spiritensis]|uniref:Transposase n=1 Tax=Aquabacter spiritensis TaxID=933073 RepID=A0A4R3LJQ2_9HYPH|nr:IS1182 family transposase [Aquabacter spiritensis]TCT00433.1 transposase [Aquabacter spiritensis]